MFFLPVYDFLSQTFSDHLSSLHVFPRTPYRLIGFSAVPRLSVCCFFCPAELGLQFPGSTLPPRPTSCVLMQRFTLFRKVANVQFIAADLVFRRSPIRNLDASTFFCG